MAVMGEVGDAQAKNIHTAEKFERSAGSDGSLNCGV